MLFADGFLGIVLVIVWIYGIVDVISTHSSQIRNIPSKMIWLVIVVLLGALGTVVWWIAGRPRAARVSSGRGFQGLRLRPRAKPSPDRPAQTQTGDAGDWQRRRQEYLAEWERRRRGESGGDDPRSPAT